MGHCRTAKSLVTWAISPSARTPRFTLKGIVGTTGTLTNQATVSGAQTDSQPSNNSATQTVTAIALSCNGKTLTIVGTPGNDTLRDTSRADVIQGLGRILRWAVKCRPKCHNSSNGLAFLKHLCLKCQLCLVESGLNQISENPGLYCILSKPHKPTFPLLTHL